MTGGERRVCIVGLGYIGLPTAAVLAARGFAVRGVDVDPAVIASVNEGRSHFNEPDLDMLVRAGAETGRLTAHDSADAADVFILCVPTPLTAEKKPDMSFVDRATEAIAPFVRPGDLVMLESTSPPGTTDRIARRLRDAGGAEAEKILVAHAPERVLPGRILREVLDNDRIVGGVDEASTRAATEFYGAFVTGEIHTTSAAVAETAKLVENAYRDVNIAFANELSVLAETLEIDVWELIRLANRHPRVDILRPGPGVGGHCIAVDPWFLVDRAPAQSVLIRTAREVNDAKPRVVVGRVLRRTERLRDPVVACLGLTYKPDVDDLRESPAVEIAAALRREVNGEVLVVEPNLDTHADFGLAPLDDALRRADVVVALVAHRPFRSVPASLLAEKIVIDTCGAFPQTTFVPHTTLD